MAKIGGPKEPRLTPNGPQRLQRAEPGPSMGTDSLSLDRDGASLDWFWKAMQNLRLAIAGIEARFGFLPPKAADAPIEVNKDGFRTITEMPNHASLEDDHQTRSSAFVSVNANIGKENAAVAELSREDQAAYRAVAAIVRLDPEARLAQQNLLFAKKMGATFKAGAPSLASQLGKMAQQPLAPGVDRAKLIGPFLEELNDPAKIHQGDHEACAATVAVMLLAKKNPAELARLVADLATPIGVAALQNGKPITRVPDWQAADGGRSISQQLLQPAFTVYSLEPEKLTYDNAADKISDGGKGMSVEEANVLLEGLTGRDSTAVDFYDDRSPARIDAALAHIKQATANGTPVPVGVTWTKGRGHKLLVERIEGDQVTYTNPYGMRERMSLDELKKRITNANLPALT